MAQITSFEEDGILTININGAFSENKVFTEFVKHRSEYVDKCQANKKPIIIIVDLKNVTFANSIGMGSLISTFAKINNIGGYIFFADATDKLQSFFTITRLSSILNPTTMEDALKQAKNLGKE